MTAFEPLLTKADVATLLRCSERTIERQVKLGAFPPAQRFGKEALWFESVVHAWLASCRDRQQRWLEQSACQLTGSVPADEAPVRPLAPPSTDEVKQKATKRRSKEWAGTKQCQPLFQAV
jgi:predicted DNA-binding transcriptional regulator AlpA